jgi:hypothetical protein
MSSKTIKRRRNVTKKRANIRRKKQTKRVKNSRRKRGGASTGWTDWATNMGQTYAPGLTQQVTTTAKGTALAQKAVQTLGENAETIDQLQTAFVAIQRQVDNQLVKFKQSKEENLLKKFQKECNGDSSCVVEKQAEFLAKEQAENMRRTAANDAFWASLVRMDSSLPEYTGLTNIELFTKIVDNWEEIETHTALISAVKSYYKCPGPNTPEALLKCFKQKADEVFKGAINKFETKLHEYVDQYLTGKASTGAKAGVTMAANAFRAAPGYAKTAFQTAKGLSQQSRSSIEPAFEQVKTMMPQTHHQHIDKMKDFLLQLHDVASKLAGLQAEVSSMEQAAEEDSHDEFEDANDE